MAAPTDLPKMTYRFLGRSGLQVSVISLGGWLTYGGHVDEEKTFACMKAAYDSGVNFFDCAEEYAGGKSEEAMGKAIKKFGWKRNDLVISTKLYWGQAFGDNPVNNRGLSRKHIIEGMAGSLARLGLEYVDVVYAHRPDRQTPMEEVVRAFNHLITTGRAFYWGTSGWSADEPAYNMLDRRRVEREYAHLYREVGLGLTVYSPLKQGILSGKYRDGIPAGSRFAQEQVDFIAGYWKRTDKDTWDAVVQQVNQLQPIADELGVKLSHLALAWVLKNPNVSSAITGASSPEQVYENVRAVGVVDKLTPEILKNIDQILGNKPPAITARF
ncbi:hypothetical protein DL764_002341 [Monosporascus ibericus]|uniref:NADP-dependent oxidoreductase domain-containing protein n=1 Tax=Monosporascus ibericus TaxID=155417 RepID=A0A4Q4TMK7_9PEZI|nr:hypothetical protein DL764_002341 [Monosporascus ibericus]